MQDNTGVGKIIDFVELIGSPSGRFLNMSGIMWVEDDTYAEMEGKMSYVCSQLLDGKFAGTSIPGGYGLADCIPSASVRKFMGTQEDASRTMTTEEFVYALTNGIHPNSPTDNRYIALTLGDIWVAKPDED